MHQTMRPGHGVGHGVWCRVPVAQEIAGGVTLQPGLQISRRNLVVQSGAAVRNSEMPFRPIPIEGRQVVAAVPLPNREAEMVSHDALQDSLVKVEKRPVPRQEEPVGVNALPPAVVGVQPHVV